MRVLSAYDLGEQLTSDGPTWLDRRLVSRQPSSLAETGLGGELREALPSALPGGYANFLAPHDREQMQNAYGCNGPRLKSLKRCFDPDVVFAFAIPLPDQL